jgi:hypothetical protein
MLSPWRLYGGSGTALLLFYEKLLDVFYFDPHSSNAVRTARYIAYATNRSLSMFLKKNSSYKIYTNIMTIELINLYILFRFFPM